MGDYMPEEVDILDMDYIQGSAIYKDMAPKERLRFNHIVRQLIYETENAFTATEYYYLAMLKLMGEDIEKFLLKGNPSEVDSDLRKEYRMMAEDILGHMEKHRESKRTVADSTKKLKELIREEAKNGDTDKGKVSAN